MARITASQIAHELDALEEILRACPEGIGRPAMEQAYERSTGHAMATRTMTRRLARLVAGARIRVEGGSKNTRYYPVVPAAALHVPPSLAPSTPVATAVPTPSPRGTGALREESIPVSSKGVDVRALVRRAISARPRVGYRAAFLERYRPGVTWYLSPAIRARVSDIGRTPDSTRPAGTYARSILDQLLIDLSWGSSRLEGNTYSRLDTRNLIEFGQRATDKDDTDAQMILNHRSAIEMLVENAELIGFDRYTFMNLHAVLSENLLTNPADEGRLRGHPVGINGSTYTPPEIPQQITEWFDLLLRKAGAIPDPFEQAFFVMVQLPYLQPFADVNKRTSRLGANIPLIQGNLFPLSFVDVPERAYAEGMLGVYEFNRIDLLRDVFVWAYERSVQQYRVRRDTMGDPDPLRLRYRAELRAAVRESVLSGTPPRREALQAWATTHGIAGEDVSGFAECALDLLLALHDGSLTRYRLQPGDFLTWKARYNAVPGTE